MDKRQQAICEALSKLTKQSLGTPGELKVFALELDGVYKNTQWFLDVTNMGDGHPFDGIRESANMRFISALCDQKAMYINTLSLPNGVVFTELAKSRHIYGALSDYAIYAPTMAGTLVIPSANTTATYKTPYNNDTQKNDISQISFNGQFVAEGFKFAASGTDVYIGQYGVNGYGSYPSYPTCNVVHYTIAEGHYVNLDTGTIGANPDVKKCLAMMPVSDRMVASLGYKVGHIDINYAGSTIALPFVRGFSRRVIVVGGGGTRKLAMIGYYVFGEDQDVACWSYGYVDKSGSSMYWGNYEGRKLLTQPKLSSSASIKLCQNMTYLKLYPLSWNPVLMNGMHLTDVSFDLEEPEHLVVGDSTVKFHLGSGTVNCVTGLMSRDTYVQMLEDGFGVLEPAKEDAITRVRASWAKIPTTLSFRFEPTPASGYSLKDTEAYKEYGKKRAKACKENNYLELAYNAEYSMKTVENKLTNLVKLDVLTMDSSLIGSFSKSNIVVDATNRTTTITAGANGSYTYATNDGTSGVVTNTETSIENMLDAVMPSKFAGETKFLDDFLLSGGEGYNLQDLNNAGAKQSYSNLSLIVNDLELPIMPSLAQLKASKTKSDVTAFMCNQITDYDEMNKKIPTLIRTTSGQTWLEAVIKKLKADGFIVEASSNP